ncbi:hypothetical protein R1flu_021549 [Riccia fluitans]|uniref:LIM zinc-binding domain-containing protein n=1 Tax=Riccia fluitans TaxID=41844 RepID=A0ABD1ZRN6_9MARC
MPRITSYVLLRGSESEVLLDERDMRGGGYHEDAVVHVQKEEVGSDYHDALVAGQNYQKSFHEQQQKQLHDVNISKGSRYGRSLSQRNLSGYHGSSGPTHGSRKDLKDKTPVAGNGELRRLVSFRDSGNAPKLALSLSGRWQVQQGGGGQAHLERTMSGRWKLSGNEQFTRSTGSPLRDHLASPKEQPTGQWADSIQRVASYRESLQQKQQQQEQRQLQKRNGCNGRGSSGLPISNGSQPPAAVCTMHSACNELRTSSPRFSRLSDKERDSVTSSNSPARRARFADEVNGKASPPRRLQRQPTARFTEWEKSARGNDGEEQEDGAPSTVKGLRRQQSSTARFTDQNTEPRVLPPAPGVSAMSRRSSSGKIVSSQRSFSMRETSSSRMDADSLPPEEAPRRKSSAATVKPRVSFSDSVNLKPDRESDADLQRIHEKWIDRPSATAIREAKMLNATTQPLRYNYEQPGFVERKSTDGCGAYSTGGFRQHGEEESTRRQQASLSRTFSTFSFADKSTHRRMAKTFTFSKDKHVQPVVVECVSCGKGLGIVVQGFPAGETSSFCKACKPGLPGAVGGPGLCGTGEFYFGDKSTTRTTSSNVKPYCKKKKSMLDYCRKLLGI